MKFRLSVLALALAVSFGAAACGDDNNDNPGGPSGSLPPKFTATLNQANEFPAINNADGTATGTATITFNTTKDAAGNITAATADFSVTMTGFPANTAITAAHIHPGAAGTAGSPLVNLNLGAGEITASASGAATITKTGISVPADQATAIVNNPSQFYFNVHTTLSPGGAIRGQLVKIQ
jgi:hypothetical protein